MKNLKLTILVLIGLAVLVWFLLWAISPAGTNSQTDLEDSQSARTNSAVPIGDGSASLQGGGAGALKSGPDATGFQGASAGFQGSAPVQ